MKLAPRAPRISAPSPLFRPLVALAAIGFAFACAMATEACGVDGSVDDTNDASTARTDAGQDAAPGDSGGSPDASGDTDAASDAGQDAGDDTLNTGDTSGAQAKAGDPGFPCTVDNNCNDFDDGMEMQGAICLTDADGYPGGYCTFSTDDGIAGNFGCNGASGVHVPLSAAFGDGYCHHPCTAPKDCRVGYRCVQGSCRPNCAVANYACVAGSCDAALKVCTK